MIIIHLKQLKGLWKGGKDLISFFDYVESKCRKQVSDISLQYCKSIELNKQKKKGCTSTLSERGQFTEHEMEEICR